MEDYMSFKQALRGFDRDEVLEYIRKHTDIQSLISSHFIDNPASGRVMEKCGFVPTGETCVDEAFAGSDRPMRVLRLELGRSDSDLLPV